MADIFKRIIATKQTTGYVGNWEIGGWRDMNIKKKRVTTLYVLVWSISILSCGCQYIKDSKNPRVISNHKGNMAKNLENKYSNYRKM